MAALSMTLDVEGCEELLGQLDFLREAPDHLHLWSESWVGSDGADLTELSLSGEGFRWCHELSVGLVEDDFFANGREASAFVEVSEGEDGSLQVALAFTASGLAGFCAALCGLAGGAVCCRYPVERSLDGEMLADGVLECYLRLI